MTDPFSSARAGTHRAPGHLGPFCVAQHALSARETERCPEYQRPGPVESVPPRGAPGALLRGAGVRVCRRVRTRGPPALANTVRERRTKRANDTYVPIGARTHRKPSITHSKFFKYYSHFGLSTSRIFLRFFLVQPTIKKMVYWERSLSTEKCELAMVQEYE